MVLLSFVKGKSKKYLGEQYSDFSQKFIMKEKKKKYNKAYYCVVQIWRFYNKRFLLILRKSYIIKLIKSAFLCKYVWVALSKRFLLIIKDNISSANYWTFISYSIKSMTCLYSFLHHSTQLLWVSPWLTVHKPFLNFFID